MRHALRFWRRHAGQAVWLISTMGLALGVAGAAWAVAGALWLRSLPYPEADRLVSAGWNEASFEGTAPPDAAAYLEWRDRQTVFVAMAGYRSLAFTDIVIQGIASEVHVAQVTTDFFDALGAVPVAGRLLRADDDGARPAAVISERLWVEMFAADPAFGNGTFQLTWFGGEIPVTVVGVMPSGARLPGGADAPLDMVMAMAADDQGQRSVIARLASQVTPDAAATQLTEFLRSVDARSSTGFSEPRRAVVADLHTGVFGETRPFAWLLLAAAGLVVMVALVNSAAIMLALAARRSRELAIRTAIGASSRRLLGLLTGEAALIATAAMAAGLLVAPGLYAAFRAHAPADLPRLAEAGVDTQTVLVVGVLGLLGCATLGSAPLFSLRRRSWGGELRDAVGATSPPRGLRARRLLLSAQIALVMGLLASSGVLLATLDRLGRQPLGFDPSSVSEVALLVPREAQSEANAARFTALVNDAMAAAEAVPGRRRVAMANATPLSTDPGLDMSYRVRVPDDRIQVSRVRMVTDGYFDVLGIDMLEGRPLTSPDVSGEAVTVASRTFAVRTFGSPAAALNQRVTMGDDEYRVVGVADDVRDGPLREPFGPTLYVPLGSRDWRWGRLLVMARDEAGQATPAALADAVRSVLPGMRVTAGTFEHRLRAQTAEARTSAAIFSLLGVFTLTLAGLGLFALIAQLVSERTRELGIRAALGAAPRQLVECVARSIVGSVVLGLTGGLLLAGLATHAIARFLFDTSPLDPTAWGGAVLVLLLVAALATIVPAWRAGQLDPVEALRGA